MSFLNYSLKLRTKLTQIQIKKPRLKKKNNLFIKSRDYPLVVRNNFLIKKQFPKNFNNSTSRLLQNTISKRNNRVIGYSDNPTFTYSYNLNLYTNKRFLFYRSHKLNRNLRISYRNSHKSYFLKNKQSLYTLNRIRFKTYLEYVNFLFKNKNYSLAALKKKSLYTQNISLSQNNTCFSFNKFLIKPNTVMGSKEHLNYFFSFKNLTTNSLLKLVFFLTSVGVTKSPTSLISDKTLTKNYTYFNNFLDFSLFNFTTKYNIIQSNTQSLLYNNLLSPLIKDTPIHVYKKKLNSLNIRKDGNNSNTTLVDFKLTGSSIKDHQISREDNFNLVFSWLLDMPLLSTHLRSTPNSTVAVTELPNYRSDIHSFVTSDTTYSNPFFDLGRITKSNKYKSKFILSSAINNTFNSIQPLVSIPDNSFLRKKSFIQTLNSIKGYKNDVTGFKYMYNLLLRKSIRYTSMLNYKLLWSLSLVVYSVYGSNIFNKTELPLTSKYGFNQKIYGDLASFTDLTFDSHQKNSDLDKLIDQLSSVIFQDNLMPSLRLKLNKESRMKFSSKFSNVGIKKKLVLLKKNSPIFSNISQTLINRKISYRSFTNFILFFIRPIVRQHVHAQYKDKKNVLSSTWEKKVNQIRSFSKITSKFVGKRKKKFSRIQFYDSKSHISGIQNTLTKDIKSYTINLPSEISKSFKSSLLGIISTTISDSVLDVYTRSKSTLFLKFISDPLLLRIQLSSFKIKNGDWKLSQVFLSNFFNKDKNLSFLSNLLQTSNLSPNIKFNYKVFKKVSSTTASKLFRTNLTPWYYHTIIRFIEHTSGRKSIFQFYPFVDQAIDMEDVVRYQLWLPRMNFYERRLGHRFFLEESLHIIHLSFILRDPKIICSWLKAMILRISFWKTRSIFRFLKYLFQNYFSYILNDLRVKGLKIRLKGKISAAGNSRKRTVLYRTGQTSHSNVSLKVLNERTVVNTFTGVMGLHVYIFY